MVRSWNNVLLPRRPDSLLRRGIVVIGSPCRGRPTANPGHPPPWFRCPNWLAFLPSGYLERALQLITDLGDQAVILPLVVAVLVLLLTLGERRAAIWWLVSVCLALGVTLVAKLVFIPCGYLLPVLDVRSPSGHAASASAAYGGLAMLFVQANRSTAARAAVLSSALAIVLAISASRILLQAHTVPETLIVPRSAALRPSCS